MRRPPGFRSTTLALALSLLSLGLLEAEPKREGWYLDQNIQGGYPGGALLGTRIYYRIPLSESSDTLWSSTKLDLGLSNSLSPAFDFVGAFISIEPIAFFDLTLSGQVHGYYKALGFGFHDMDGYQSPFDLSTLGALPAKDAVGFSLAASPRLKLALGPFVLVDAFTITWLSVDGGTGYFYEAVSNCILAKNGVELSNQAYLLYRFSPSFLLGVNDSLLNVPASGYTSHALHAVGTYAPTINERISLYSAVMIGLYVRDRYYEYMFHATGTIGLTLAL